MDLVNAQIPGYIEGIMGIFVQTKSWRSHQWHLLISAKKDLPYCNNTAGTIM